MADKYTAGVVAMLTGVELLGDMALKSAADTAHQTLTSNWPMYAVGVAAYACLGIVIYTSDYAGLMWGVSNSYWNAVNNLVTPLVFMLVFGEQYSATQWVGFAVISAGILLVGYG